MIRVQRELDRDTLEGVERFDEEAVRRILARSCELDPGRDEAVGIGDGVDAEALIAAAEDVGYDSAIMRESIAIERLGPRPETSSVLDRVAGPSIAVRDLRVDRDTEATLDVAEAWLAQAHRMTVWRTSPTTLIARRRSDIAATIGRRITEVRGDGRVGRIAALNVEVAAVSRDQTMVRLGADLNPVRRRRLTAGGILASTGVATIAVGLGEAMFAWPIAAAVLLSAGGATAASGRRHADRVEADLEALAAVLTVGESPVGTLRRVARAARRSAER